MSDLKQKVESFSQTDLKNWLNRVLQGVEIIPKATPDESPHFAILDLDRELDKPTRLDLRSATESLLTEHAEQLEELDLDYARSLLHLAEGFDLDPLDRALTRAIRGFSRNSATLPLRRFILNLLHNRSGAPHFEFWEELLQEEPALGGPCFAAMLKQRPVKALRALPLLPDDPVLADGVTAQLELEFSLLQGSTRETFLSRIRETQNDLSPQLAKAIGEWLAEHDSISFDIFECLDAALKQHLPDYKPEKGSARLLGTTQEKVPA